MARADLMSDVRDAAAKILKIRQESQKRLDACIQKLSPDVLEGLIEAKILRQHRPEELEALRAESLAFMTLGVYPRRGA